MEYVMTYAYPNLRKITNSLLYTSKSTFFYKWCSNLHFRPLLQAAIGILKFRFTAWSCITIFVVICWVLNFLYLVLRRLHYLRFLLFT